MPAGMQSKGENINHCNGVRIRILGSGNVKLKLLGLPNDNNVQVEYDLPDLNLNTLNQNREPLKKANFKSQRMQLEIKTTEINEFWKINRLIIFAKPIYVNFPG